ncbi:MAG: glycosyltransferase [Deltaproteobacteria bacterium]|nr:glycosyltransferase [Deltaproteobacteria bacterium]
MMALVDIIVPTYNRASLLPETLKSVQQQTLDDWRCFIAEDGETPETRAAVAPFLKDDRFTYLPGTHTGTPAAPRNRAIKQGGAPLIAFLDDDDLWLPEKLKFQLSFMKQHPACALLGANAHRWDGKYPLETGVPFFPQMPGTRKISFESLVTTNSIINSTAIIRRSVLSRSGMLNEAVELASGEDYELWLRIAPLGEVWILDNALAVYRDVPHASIREGWTPRVLNKKLIFIFSAALRGSETTKSPLTYPENRSFALLCRRQLARLRRQELLQRFFPERKAVKSHIKTGLLACGRHIGRLCSFFMKNPGPREPAIFLLCPYYHTGGAERVHADIIACLQDYRPRVIIGCKSNNTAFKKAFSQGSRLIDISFFSEKPLWHPIIIGCLTEIINRTGNAVVLGCNSFLFYHCLPYFAEKIKKIDIIHSFTGILEIYSLPLVPLLDERVVINSKMLGAFAQVYAEHGVSPVYLNRIKTIENKVPVPAHYQKKSFDTLRVLYVGRGTEEKRVHLVGKIAARFSAINPDMRFCLIGDVVDSVSPEDRRYCVFEGELHDDAVLNSFYRSSHIILITSKFEGSPLVLMEAMACGVVPIATHVGAIDAHVHNGSNGFLIDQQDEHLLVEAFVEKIQGILADREEYHRLSRTAYDYAVEKASHNDAFCREYVRLLTQPKQS